MRRKVEETIAGTVIHQRQFELAPGRWDFVVFGPSPGSKRAVLRVGAAEQMMIRQASVYIASVGDPGRVGQGGMMSLDELTGGDVSEELAGLDVYHVSPLRPMEITGKRTGEDLDRMRGEALEEFGDRNVAIIETPDEEAWALSALKYLDECDETFPDRFISTIRSRMRDTSMTFNQSPLRLN